MAKCFTTCTSSNVLALFSLTVCVMLATSAPTVHVRQASSGCEHIDRRDIFGSRTNLLQTINRTLRDFNVNTTLDLCKIVDSYYQVKAVDSTSNIYNTLKTIANDTLTFWKTAHCTDNCTDVDLEEFRRRCQLQKVHTLLETVHPGAFVKRC